MSNRAVETASAPLVGFSAGTAAPLSQAVVHGDVIYCSGTGPLDPVTHTIVSAGFAEQVRQTLANLVAVVEAAGGSKDSIIKCNCYLRDIADFPEFNRHYREFFSDCPTFPARTTVNAAPPREGVLVEIECVAALTGRPA
ncbi:2-iminobutanoate/2-iminopropanoate deaminase [Thermocatellispora tengchongensis]|uniref:2-iminobutanoate/2-iminopropanoate deaminase n=1 Tax=Thermocatellispora tengchongensis TaxID=1073253 RepID=A0A840P1P6_9ACTN|nr:RidA family protein [Thermocatellispora tengchongensis]MBB5133618.1 2-iminobutanoate/2-iminopropanoate deaminase [Thermocatellispora tengchongensis]